MKRLIALLVIATSFGCASYQKHSPRETKKNALVVMTDFGVRDGAVSEMKGVAYGVDSHLLISDLSHQIEPFNIWEGAYRLYQTASYWPAGTVFVSVVDPGVGTARRSIVAKSRNGQLFVNPDNGLLTLIQDNPGIESIRIIDESRHRLQGSEKSYTFYGRDLYMYTGAKLATGAIRFEDVGIESAAPLVMLPFQKPELLAGDRLVGQVPAIDINFGNVWTNIPRQLFKDALSQKAKIFKVEIFNAKKLVYSGEIPFAHTFNDVRPGQPLVYINSLLNVAVALNQANFAEKYKIGAGPTWRLEISPIKK